MIRYTLESFWLALRHVPGYRELRSSRTPLNTLVFAQWMAPNVLGGAPVRGNHLGTVELTDCCTLQVRVGAAIDMRSRGRAVRGRESAPRSQKSSFPLK